jgi:hypothetical protein
MTHYHQVAGRVARQSAKPIRFADFPPRPLTIAEGVEAIARWRAAWPEVAAACDRIGKYASSRKVDAVRWPPIVFTRRHAAIIAACLPPKVR